MTRILLHIREIVPSTKEFFDSSSPSNKPNNAYIWHSHSTSCSHLPFMNNGYPSTHTNTYTQSRKLLFLFFFNRNPVRTHLMIVLLVQCFFKKAFHFTLLHSLYLRSKEGCPLMTFSRKKAGISGPSWWSRWEKCALLPLVDLIGIIEPYIT